MKNPFINLKSLTSDRKIYVNSQMIASILEYETHCNVCMFGGECHGTADTYDEIIKKINKAGQFLIENINITKTI
jgi:hypothetical protein